MIENLRQHLLDLIDEARAVALQAQIAALTPSLFAASPVNPLAALGGVDESSETWMVDLARPAEDIRRGYSELTRRELRKASKSGVRLREAAGPRDLDAYYRLHLETYARTSARAHPLGYFQAIFERFQPRGLARILLAERGGEVVAAQNTARYKGGAVYWTGASASEKSGGENRLLFDAQIMAAREDGLLRYETGQAFVESNDAKERGLSQFKRSFGATLRPYYRGMLPATRAGRRLLWGLRRVARSVASARS